MKKIMTSTIAATIVLSGTLPIHGIGNLVAHAEIKDAKTKEEEKMTTELTGSLKDLAIKAVDAQIRSDDMRQTPNVKLLKLPNLNSDQDEVKAQITKWTVDIQPHLFNLNQEDKRLVRKFNTYQKSIKEIIDDVNMTGKEKQERLAKYLTNLQEQTAQNSEKVTSEIDRLKKFKTNLQASVTELAKSVDEGVKLLGDADTQSGKYATLAKQITTIKGQIDTDLENISKLPDSITESAWDVFEFTYKKSKLVIDAATQSVMAAFEKGQQLNAELDKQIEDLKAKGEEKNVIEKAKADFWEKHKGEKAAAAAAEAGKFDVSKAVDPTEIKKFMESLKATSKMSQLQLKSLQDIGEQNQKLYDVTKDLKITEIQASLLIDMKHNVNLFAKNIDSQITMLTEHQADINTIGKMVAHFSQSVAQPQWDEKALGKELRLLTTLYTELGKQTETFEKITTK